VSRWYGYQDRATGELFAYSRRRLQSLPKSVIVLRWRTLPKDILPPYARPVRLQQTEQEDL